jgi:transcriptional regulator with XRE-family HTH domain
VKTSKWRDVKRPGNPNMERGYQIAAIASMTLCGLREQAGLSQSTLASRLGVSQSWIAQIEAETDMRLSTIAAYVAALGADLHLAATLADGRQIPLDALPAPEYEMVGS